jgi:hypothetical protein
MTILAGLVLLSAAWAIAAPRKYKTSRTVCGIFSGLALLLLITEEAGLASGPRRYRFAALTAGLGLLSRPTAVHECLGLLCRRPRFLVG